MNKFLVFTDTNFNTESNGLKFAIRLEHLISFYARSDGLTVITVEQFGDAVTVPVKESVEIIMNMIERANATNTPQ